MDWTRVKPTEEKLAEFRSLDQNLRRFNLYESAYEILVQVESASSQGSDKPAQMWMKSGQSRGQHDWVHRFPEPVKSFITFVILSQISCGKVQKKSYFFLHKTVSKFLLGLL